MPDATFGSGKNCHEPKFANFGLFISLMQFFGYFCPKNRTNEINSQKYSCNEIRTNEIRTIRGLKLSQNRKAQNIF